MITAVDSCPRCGFVLQQPEPPTTPATAPPPPVLFYAVPYSSSPAPSQPAPSQPPASSGLSAASVPKLLLGLGAICLLIAAVIFLAVAWSWLDIGGRTA